MFFLGHQVNDLFFWPAAAAYPVSLAGITAAMLLIINGCTTRREGRVGACMALLVAMLSAETGWFFAAGLGGPLLLEFSAILRKRARGIAKAAW